MSHIPRQSEPLIIALTHERELTKKTNTGQLLLQLPVWVSRRVIWKRTLPDPWLLKLIENQRVAILYPDLPNVADQLTSERVDNDQEIQSFDHFIVIDSTWQEARKIMNRSAYLQKLPRVALPESEPSKFHLRRNQVEGGLCTVEAAISLMRCAQCDQHADHLEILFNDFINQTSC